MMTLEFTYTPQDMQEWSAAALTEANKEAKKQQRAAQGGRSVIGWVAFVGLAVFLFLMMQRKQPPGAVRVSSPDPWPMLIRMSPFILIIAALWIFAKFGGGWLGRRGARKLWEREATLKEPHTIEITDEGVRLASTSSSTAWKWPNFTHLTETANLFLLKQSDGTHLIVPKRAVPPGELERLRLMIEEHLGVSGAFPVLPPKQT
jgi:hypothetical protein